VSFCKICPAKLISYISSSLAIDSPVSEFLLGKIADEGATGISWYLVSNMPVAQVSTLSEVKGNVPHND